MSERVKGHELDQTAKRYVLSILERGVNDEPLNTTNAKLEYLRGRASEFTHNIPRMGHHNACEAWLRGLSLNIEYMNYAILILAKKWGSLPENPTEQAEDKLLNNYWSFMATKVCQLIDGYRIPKELT